MKIEFDNSVRKDCLIVISDDCEEAEALIRWDNSVVSAKFNYDYSSKPPHAILLLMKEI